jgi:hypothetical protein
LLLVPPKTRSGKSRSTFYYLLIASGYSKVLKQVYVADDFLLSLDCFFWIPSDFWVLFQELLDFLLSLDCFPAPEPSEAVR